MSSVQSQPIVATPLAGFSSNATSGLTILPAGFPSSINGNSVWTGSGITDEDYVFHLAQNELAEISKAVVAFKSKCRPLDITSYIVPARPRIG